MHQMVRIPLIRIPWKFFLMVGGLILFDLALHPLTFGPDRLIHDPAVYRLWDSSYMSGDWYTEMAFRSGIYFFYAKLVNFYHFLHLPEELWRTLLYLVSLVVLYYSLIKISGFFTKSILVVPFIALLHALFNTGVNQPAWLYGPFMQIDGGLAPRPLGTALSFFALWLLLKGSILFSAGVLGIATLIHVSNSFVVFTLFLLSWAIKEWFTKKEQARQKMLLLVKQGVKAILTYLVFGGWFAFYALARNTGIEIDVPTEKFIWVWTYFRAPYMALPEIAWVFWLRFLAHIIAAASSWYLIRKALKGKIRQALDVLGVVGLGTVGYFFLFYFFAFLWPWLPGFQFYSIRIVYFVYFTAYLFISLLFLSVINRFWGIGFRSGLYRGAVGLLSAALLIIFLGGGNFAREIEMVQKMPRNIVYSWRHIRASQKNKFSEPLPHATIQYLKSNPQVFLGPPNLSFSPVYLPNIASFKSFGFTKEGLPEWFKRINDISQGELQRRYEAQVQTGNFAPVDLNWAKLYSKLTVDQISALSHAYNFQFFLTYRDLSYPFQKVSEDSDFSLYELPREER